MKSYGLQFLAAFFAPLAFVCSVFAVDVDLAVTGFTAFQPSPIAPGGHPTSITYSLHNYGPGSVGSGGGFAPILIDLWISSNGTFGDGDDLYLGQMQFSISSPAGSDGTYTHSNVNGLSGFTIPAEADGNYQVFLKITHPPGSGRTDPDLSDNIGLLSGTITVGAGGDTTPPTVTSINRLTPSGQITSAASVVWRVTFSEHVNNVSTADFTLVDTSGTIIGESITAVSASSGTAIDVTVNTGGGNGDLRLDVVIPGATIRDDAGNSLNSSFTGGQVYTINKTAPTVAISDATVSEGNGGVTDATLFLTLSSASSQRVSVHFATSDFTAKVADNDYVPTNGTVLFLPGETNKAITVQVKGDANLEPKEAFLVNLDSPSNATIQAGSGTVNIIADDFGKIVGWGFEDRPQLSTAVGIAEGEGFMLALNPDGTVFAWGAPNDLSPTVVPAELSNVIAVAAGPYHSLALKSDGTVVAWGLNFANQLTVPSALSNVVAISGGGAHSLALKADGTVVAWGWNDFGQATVPPALSGVMAIAAGGSHSLALKSNGVIVAWGDNGSGQATIPPGLTSVSAISAGYEHSLALRSDGTVIAWGNDNGGQATIPEALSNVMAIAAGGQHNLALKSNGTVIAWGNNGNDQTAVPVGLSNVVAIAASGFHSSALQHPEESLYIKDAIVSEGDSGKTSALFEVGLTSPSTRTVSVQYRTADGSAKSTSGDYVPTNGMVTFLPGQTKKTISVTINGDKRLEPTQFFFVKIDHATNASVHIGQASGVIVADDPGVLFGWGAITTPEVPDALAIASGFSHGLVLRADRTVLAWGGNDNGEATVPDGLKNVVAVAAGGLHSLALRSNGTVVAWGLDQGGISVPVGLSSVVAISAGLDRSIALRSDGTVVSWDGGGWAIQTGLQGVVAVSAGGYHFLALESDGNVVAWGQNVSVPVDLSSVVAIAAGGEHDLALKSDGTVVAWGQNNYGQATVPVGLTNATAISAGYWSSMALKSDGTMVAWGLTTPPPEGVSGVTAIAAGGDHNLALLDILPIKANLAGLTLSSGTFTPAFNSNIVSYSANVPYNVASTFVTPTAADPAATIQVRLNEGEFGTVVSGMASAPLNLSVGSNTVELMVTGQDATTVKTYTVTINRAAPSLPTAATQMTFIRSTVATLNGMAVPNGSATTTWFEWGTNISYGNHSAATNVASGLSVVSVATMVSNLLIGQAYHCRLVASNSAGMVYGADQPFAVGKRVLALGRNDDGQRNVPASLSEVVGIAGGLFHSLALTRGGTVAAWGYDNAGQSSVSADLSNVVAVAGGGVHGLALRSDGTVAAWGDDTFGQITVPEGLSNVVAIAGGGAHSLALKRDGTLVAWGAGKSNTGTFPDYGQSIVPAGLSNVVTVAAGNVHSLALRSDGTIAAWGYNDDGQASVPAGLSNVVAIAGGCYHSLALRSNGTVAAWGWNDFGQSSVPADLNNVVAMAGGVAHSVAVKSDGTMVAWGDNFYGQSSVPAGLSNVVAIATGGYHSLALVANVETPRITSYSVSSNGAFQFAFVNPMLDDFTVLVTTNVNLPSSNWIVLGPPQSVGGGIYQFTDTAATNYSRRFYRLRSP